MLLSHTIVLIALCFFTSTFAQSTVEVHTSKNNLTYVGVNAKGVEHFLNIRYGEDTSGENRFKHPKPFAYPTNTVIQATRAGPSCPQNTIESFAGLTLNPGVYSLSEDCLNLRIDRPAGTKANANLPVFVWIYGGGDETGSINYTLYDPTNLVLGAAQKQTPVLFVAMNYRLNVFGFANSSALRQEKSLNTGLFDQRLALEWISENIAAFGGNAKEVTLFGQSDGGVSVGLHLTAYGGKCKPYFNRGIMESGSPSGDPGMISGSTTNSTTTVAKLAGCSDSNSSTVLTCLRKLPMQKLLNAVLKFENMSQTSEDVFFPTVDGDLIPELPSTLLRTGAFHKNISVISGWTHDDGSIFTPPTLSSEAEVDEFVQASYFGFNATTRKLVISLYPLTDFVEQAQLLKCSPYFLQAAKIYRDLNFACPNIDAARYVSKYGASSWIYELNTTSFDGVLKLSNASFEGVIHISDVPFVFNQANLGLGISAAQNVTQQRMSGSWAKFASKGDPSGNQENSLFGWTKAFSDKFNGSITQANVRIIGGPEAGLTTLTDGGGGLEHGLLERCQKIFTIDGYRQFGA